MFILFLYWKVFENGNSGLNELNELLKEKEFKFPGFVLSYELKELKELLL